MNFQEKEIARAIRKYNDLTNDVLNSASQVYQDRVIKLVNFFSNNKVMNHLISPYLEIELEANKYVKEIPDGWYDLFIPESEEKEIAFALQILFDSVNEEFNFANWGTKVVKESNFDQTVYKLNSRIFQPVFRELGHKLNDLFEDEVKGKNQVQSSNLQIINYGNIDSKNSNIALGQNINQTQEIGLKEEVIKNLLKNGFSFDEVKKIESEIEDITQEVQKENPDKGIFKKALNKIYKVGEKTAITILSNTISNPTFIAVINEFTKKLA